jgi:signal transduction histidine kinase
MLCAVPGSIRSAAPVEAPAVSVPASTPSPTDWPWPTLSGWLRAGIAALCIVVAAGETGVVAALPWAMAIVALELAAGRARTGGALVALLAVETVLAATAVVTTFPGQRAMLPLLLVPAFRAGEVHGPRAALGTSGALVAVTGLVVSLSPDAADLAAAVQWSALAVGIAVLGAWNARLDRQRQVPASELAREAGQLLGRLQDLARALPAGFDVPAVAEMLADDALREAPADRVAALVHIGPDEVSPVVVRGVDRVPWRDPVRAPGTAHTAWTTRRTVHDVRTADREGRRAGSAMLVVPIADRDDELLGLLVLERMSGKPFRADEIAAVEHAVAAAAPRLHAALAFVELRTLAEVAERERLAREMHDGIAQDLVVVGFGLDAVQRRLRDREPELASEVAAVRGVLNQTIRDIRFSIATLRSSVRPERGLGAALSSAAQTLGPATGASVTFSLKESAFRLPAHVESALLRLAQDFFADVRTSDDVTAVHVTLETDAPAARLELRSDGSKPWSPEPVFTATLTELGGALTTARAETEWVSVLTIGELPADTDLAEQREPVADPFSLSRRMSA